LPVYLKELVTWRQGGLGKGCWHYYLYLSTAAAELRLGTRNRMHGP
jgi:hypothetical protein